MSFNSGVGDGTNLFFSITVDSDDFVEWDESIKIMLADQIKTNVMIDSNNNQVNINLIDQDGKCVFAN